MRVRISYGRDAAKFDYGREFFDGPVRGAGYEGGYSSMRSLRGIGSLVEWFDDGTGLCRMDILSDGDSICR